MKQLLLTAIASLGLLLSYGQQTINGTVVDTDNVPLIGANILVKATLTGTTTDLDGKFSLELPPGEQVLEISYTGYNSQEITVSPGQENLNVVMSFGQTLSEVVITGYGAQDRNSITGSVASVNAERIESFPIASIDQVLQGQAPGLIVLGGSGQPGSNNVSIVLRGPSTIQGSNNPIYIMDGIQISSKDFAALNINDIDEISILKDASSTAIYGASGANGVILITTKEGFDGKTKVSYNGQYGITSRARDRFDMMNSAQKLDFEALARRGPGWNLLPENPANAGLDETQLAANADQLEKLRNINTNWRDVVFRTGRTQSHNLGIRGGDNNTKFYFAGNYYQEDGVLRGSDFGRGTLRANFSEQVNDWMKIGIKASTGFSKSHQIQSENSINLNNPAALAYLINPYETVRDDDGNYTFGPTGRNPVEEAEFNYDETDVNKIVGQVYTEIEPLAGLKFTGRWGIDNTNVTSKDFIDPNSRLSTTVQGSQGQLDKNVAKTTWLTFSHVLNYKKIINDKHRFDILVGQETRKRNKDNYGFSVFGLTGGLESPAGATPGSAANPNFIPTTTGAVRKKILESYLARLNYTMDDKYNLTVGFRRDGNSVFGKNNKWGNFWNAGASWIVSRESFLQNNRVLNFLKLGISYGTNGNSEGIAEREQYTLY
ncbi:MAG TPA: SusC/RagA family TonB-linked outer membrane protein, partial [Saprospiraceae bacterium]|nr:SusC/RagA family TonB-linked outer membrane protein [Saprospiraceae bacterium]